jgi:hypothetical protein
MPLSFMNLERLRVFSACMVLMAAAVTVSSILSTIQLMKPIRILMDQAPVTAEYHPAKFVVTYKTLALDGSLQTVSQDSLSRRHRNLLQPPNQQQHQDGAEIEMTDAGHAHTLDQVRYVTLRRCSANMNCRPLRIYTVLYTTATDATKEMVACV